MSYGGVGLRRRERSAELERRRGLHDLPALHLWRRPALPHDGGVQDLGEAVMEELLLDWLYSFLTVEEQDRLTGWHLGVSL